MGHSRSSCYCAFCRTPRTYYRKKHISVLDFLVAGFMSALLMFSIWQRVEPRAFLFWIVIIVIMEFAIQIRWRLSLSCKHCGFDPALYVKDPSLAADKVQKFLARRKEEPEYLFSQPLSIPIRKVKAQPKEKGSQVSKVI